MRFSAFKNPMMKLFEQFIYLVFQVQISLQTKGGMVILDTCTTLNLIFQRIALRQFEVAEQ